MYATINLEAIVRIRNSRYLWSGFLSRYESLDSKNYVLFEGVFVENVYRITSVRICTPNEIVKIESI